MKDFQNINFDDIYMQIKETRNIIESIKNIGINKKIQNIDIQYNNKLVELINEFKHKEISFDNETELRRPIMNDLIQYINQGKRYLKEAHRIITILNENGDLSYSLDEPQVQELLLETLYMISTYNKFDKYVFEYNIKENIVDSVDDYLREFKNDDIRNNLQEKIKIDLIKLGYPNQAKQIENIKHVGKIEEER